MNEPEVEPRHAEEARFGLRPLGLVFASLVLGAALLLPPLRAFRVVDWPWGVALAPFTLVGAIVSAVAVWVYGRHGLAALRDRLGGGGVSLTPAPEQLGSPVGAKEAGDGILVRHPEILAAICHGIAYRKLLPTVLNRPTEDPWGVYEAALEANADAFGELRLVAEQHVRLFAKRGRRRGRLPSDARVLKKALEVFHRCAAKAQAGRADPGCTFEHVTTIFGAVTPARDRHLKAIAPKVRKLLEREYPQLSTATLGDGSSVKYEEWRKEAARDREELAKVRKEYERMSRRVEDVQAELEEARADADALRESRQSFRVEARRAARAAQEERVRELQDALRAHQKDEVRQLNRFEAMKARLEDTIATLTAERDELEEALFDAAPEDDEAEGGLAPDMVEALAGLRVLLVGGHEGQIPPIRDHLESLGVQLSHADGPIAADQVGTMHAVVLWVRFLAHDTAWVVKPECRARGIPCLYWSRTSPQSLASKIAERMASDQRRS